MKKHGERVPRFATSFAVCVLLVLLGLFIAGCIPTEEPVDYEKILSRVREGDKRQQALRALSDAWYHSECRYGDVVEDMFFYGPKHPDKVTIVTVLSEPQDEQLQVYLIGTYESYFLDSPGFGEFCEPPLHEAFEQDR
jgi:hypothetical protein